MQGAAVTNLVLRSGAQTSTVAVPAVEAATKVAVSLTVGGKQVGEDEATLKPVRKWQVYLLPHSHVDIGYTHVQTDVERAQWKYIDMGIEAARKSAAYPVGSRFKWNVEVLWAVDSYIKQATPDKRAAFFAAVRAGQLGRMRSIGMN